ncbi:type II secretion system F family protein [Paenibacillus sp. FSL H8-0457]|uniref:type II secretion system F family protein n=1 Tax=Bacillales TaxID=1385 RepID=UPI0003E2B72F|nr:MULTISPECIES: type II secretion system F family protein [Paenibacillus]ETT56596.1 Type II secretion system F domain-containing protein [Paenibacillus sp. FSL H8-457]MCM3259903.1 type II secretion system F family protein [Paenibacillus lautus]
MKRSGSSAWMSKEGQGGRVIKRSKIAGKPEHAAAARTHALPDYSVYHLSMSHRTACVILGGLLFCFIGYLFYHNLILSLLLGAGGLMIPKLWRRFMLERRRRTLNLHFKQALYSLSSSLSAGRSVENGFRDAVQDLLLLDPGGSSDLIFELKVIVSRLEYGEPIEVALQDFARRAGMEDLTNFADVFSTCKRTGGDLVEVVRRTSSVIGEKLDIQQEISVMIAQKRFESKALLAAPFLLLLFMNMTSPDYMEPMYSGSGFMISTFALAALGGCFLWITKMMNIKV